MKGREQHRLRWSNEQDGWWGWRPFVLILASILAVACAEPPASQAGDRAQTGYTVQTQFTLYYEQYGAALLGEPISGLCEIAGGGQAQYFQHARLELTADGQNVALYPLGEWAYAGVRRKTAAPVPENSRGRHFPETGFYVRDEFLDFYEANDGETILGPPISPQLDEGALRVQYFRNGRLEWHPDAPVNQRVRPGMLGQAHYLQAAHDVKCDYRARPVDVTTVQSVRVLASAEAPILYTGEEQMFFAMVTTSAGVPVAGVPVTLTLKEADWTLTVDLGRTDSQGKVQGGLQMPRFVPGRMVGVRVNAQGLGGMDIGQTGLAFQTWW